MCRIFGYIGKEKIHQTQLEKSSHLQIHGGPDTQTFIHEENWALSNNRLAVQGIDGGKQPFSIDDKIHVVFNGEIYNHNELRKMLVKRGHEFKDTCDGNILAYLYFEFGDDFATYLDGMFAVAVIDKRNGLKLVLASDPAGIKSLYYCWNPEDKTLKFSSELPSLLAIGKVSKEVRPEAVDEYLTGKAIWGPETIYKNIFSLPPSTLLISSLNETPRLINYISAIDVDIKSVNLEDAGFHLNSLLEAEVSKLMSADVPVCVVTSGGLDSSYISALASQNNTDLHSFNIWYEGSWPNDERHFAKEVADLNNTTHHQILIQEAQFPDIIDKMIKHLGQPNSAPHSLSTYVLFEEVKKAGFKVALTGEGADEFFGGYARFATASSDPSKDWLPRYLDKLSAVSINQRENLYTADYQNYINSFDSLFSRSQCEILKNEIISQNRLQTLLNFDQAERFPAYILRRVDHLSMAHSVEVRVPFCQPKIISFSKKIPNLLKVSGDQIKRILYQAAKGKLPQSVLSRPKQPFLLPISSMLKKGHILFELLFDTLNSQRFHSRNLFNKSEIKNLFDMQAKTPSDSSSEALWSLMILELWLQATTNTISI